MTRCTAQTRRVRCEAELRRAPQDIRRECAIHTPVCPYVQELRELAHSLGREHALPGCEELCMSCTIHLCTPVPEASRGPPALHTFPKILSPGKMPVLNISSEILSATNITSTYSSNSLPCTWNEESAAVRGGLSRQSDRVSQRGSTAQEPVECEQAHERQGLQGVASQPLLPARRPHFSILPP